MSKKYSNYKNSKELDAEVEKVPLKHSPENYSIEPDGQYGMYVIRIEQGHLHSSLGGRFTTRADARKAILDYAKTKTVPMHIREEDWRKKQEVEAAKRKREAAAAKIQETDKAALDSFMKESGIIVG